MVLNGLFATLLINGSALLDARVVAFKLYASVGWEVEDALHGFTTVKVLAASHSFVTCLMTWGNLPNLEHTTAIGSGPDAQNIFTVAHAQHGTADFLASITKLIADEGKQQVFPVAVSNALFHPDDPFSSLSVDFILPDGPDILLEKVVVGDNGQRRGPLEM